MAEWLIEEGIGETRALLVDKGDVRAARLLWAGEIMAGQVYVARLTAKPAGGRRGIATLANGAEALVDHLPAALTEGAALTLRIHRAPIAERGRLKRAQGRFVDEDEPCLPLPDMSSKAVRAFAAGMWEEVWHSASSGSIAFPQGEILCSVTPAMTLIDVDGPDHPGRTANAAVSAIGKALRWFDLGGSIGIDFPTVHAKADRKLIDALLAAELADWPHERTAMNGFGFVQLVARLEGPSLLHRFATSRTGMCARYALRVAERAEGHGPVLELRIHPALKAKIKPEWLAELARRTGREVRVEADPSLALEAPSAQIVSA